MSVLLLSARLIAASCLAAGTFHPGPSKNLKEQPASITVLLLMEKSSPRRAWQLFQGSRRRQQEAWNGRATGSGATGTL